MNIIKNFMILGLAVLLTSCASIGKRMARISPGMTKPEVVHILGKPKSSSGSSGVEVLHYTQDDVWWRNSYYYVRFVDGKVDAYGLEGRGPGRY